MNQAIKDYNAITKMMGWPELTYVVEPYENYTSYAIWVEGRVLIQSPIFTSVADFMNGALYVARLVGTNAQPRLVDLASKIDRLSAQLEQVSQRTLDQARGITDFRSDELKLYADTDIPTSGRLGEVWQNCTLQLTITHSKELFPDEWDDDLTEDVRGRSDIYGWFDAKLVMTHDDQTVEHTEFGNTFWGTETWLESSETFREMIDTVWEMMLGQLDWVRVEAYGIEVGDIHNANLFVPAGWGEQEFNDVVEKIATLLDVDVDEVSWLHTGTDYVSQREVWPVSKEDVITNLKNPLF